MADDLYSKAEALQEEAREVFYKYDLNNNGYLEFMEMKSLLLEYVGVDAEDVEQITNEYDDDHDGKISFQEFVSHYNGLVRKTRGKNKNVSPAKRSQLTLTNMFPKGRRVALIFALTTTQHH